MLLYLCGLEMVSCGYYFGCNENNSNNSTSFIIGEKMKWKRRTHKEMRYNKSRWKWSCILVCVIDKKKFLGDLHIWEVFLKFVDSVELLDMCASMKVS